MLEATPREPEIDGGAFSLEPAQVASFETFGFLALPGLFAPEIDAITEAFDRKFAATPPEAQVEQLDPELVEHAFATTNRIDSYHHLHRGRHRAIIPDVIERTPDLTWLREDPRVTGLADSLLGPGNEYQGSDGNLLDCDTSWHCDVYKAPLEQYHIKILFYLDPLGHDSGALRVIPGTHYYRSPFATRLRRDLDDWQAIPQILGLQCDEVPSHTIPTRPGDVVVINFRVMHATFGGPEGRRLFTLNYRSTAGPGPGGD
jgi:hypothetical protein